jgi:hypothetical protein
MEEFEGLSVGDLIEAVPLFPALGPEPVVLRTSRKAHDKAEFVVTYHGVTLGRWVAQRDTKGGLTWTLS